MFLLIAGVFMNKLVYAHPLLLGALLVCAFIVPVQSSAAEPALLKSMNSEAVVLAEVEKMAIRGQDFNTQKQRSDYCGWRWGSTSKCYSRTYTTYVARLGRSVYTVRRKSDGRYLAY